MFCISKEIHITDSSDVVSSSVPSSKFFKLIKDTSYVPNLKSKHETITENKRTGSSGELLPISNLEASFFIYLGVVSSL